MNRILKYSLLLLLTLPINKTFSQVVFPVNEIGEIEYTKVIIVDSTSADKLYSRAKMSIAEMFKSAQNVIQNDDATNKQILVKGVIKVEHNYNGGLATGSGVVNFTFKIFCKDNRYKYSITPFNHECGVGNFCSGGSLLNESPACGWLYMSKKSWDTIKTKVNNDLLSLIKSLNDKMIIETGGGEDW